AFLARTGRPPPLSRTRWTTPDGDFVDVDWSVGPAGSPLVVVFHGLEGSSASHYARVLACAVAEAGWRTAVPHFRGCSGEPNLLPRAYHSGDSAEIGWMAERFAAETSGPLVFVGVSLGGNVLLKWLGEAGSLAASIVSCAA